MSWLLWFLLLGSLTLVPRGHATTYWVSGTLGSAGNCTNAVGATPPSNYLRTIAAGLNCLATDPAAPPHTLFVRTGTYNEAINTNTQTVRSGTSNSARITISRYQTEVVSLTGCAGAIVNLPGGVQYLTLDGLILDASVAPCTQCLSLGDNTDFLRFTNGEIKRPFDMGIQGAGTGHEFSYSKIWGAGYRGGSEPCAESIFGCYGTYLFINNSTFHHNEVFDNAGYGILLYASEAIYQGTVNNNIVHSNVFYNNGHFDGLRGSVLHALQFEQGGGNIAYNNVFYNNMKGIGVSNTAGQSNNQLYNNTIYNTTSAYGIQYFSSIGTQIKNNLLAGTGANIVNDGGNTSPVEDQNFCTTAGDGCELVGSADFVNVAGNNFRLQATSDAIDVALDLSTIFPSDYDGTVIRDNQGAGWDAGAFEFVGTDTTLPSDVTGLTATTLSTTVIRLDNYTATDNSGTIVGFHVERCTGPACASAFTDLGVFSPVPPADDPGLTPGLTYGYRMKAEDPAGNLSANWSTPIRYATTTGAFPAVPTSASLSMPALSFPTAPTGPSLTLSPVTPPSAPTGPSLSMPGLTFPTAPTAPTLGVAP